MSTGFKVIDLSYLESITDGDDDLIIELIDIFISQISEFTEGFKEHLKNKEWKELAALAHKAKSSVISMGMDNLGNVDLKNLELIAKKIHLNELNDKTDKTEKELQEIDVLNKNFNNFQPNRIEWIEKNTNIDAIDRIISVFNDTCQVASKELTNYLENKNHVEN